MIGAIGRWIPCVVLALLAAAAGTSLVHESLRARPLPPPPIVAEAPPTPLMVVARQRLGGHIETAHYTIIAVRNLFAATRGEAIAAAATEGGAPSGPKPFLHGVVLDGPQSRAYLEDPVGQRVAGYALGDTVGGGKLVRILEDRVVIRRPDGPIEVMLKDPAKPLPAPPASSTPGAAPAHAPATAPAVPDAAAAPAPAPTAESPPASTAPAAPKGAR
jgi:hypothetical protein